MSPDLSKLSARTEDKKAFRVVVESPRGSLLKLKYDPALRAFTLSRALPEGLSYPYDWGFVPGTKAADGDPVDALVYWDRGSVTGLVHSCRALGVIKLEQDKRGSKTRQRNDRIVAVPIAAERMDDVRSYRDLTRRRRDEIGQFFLNAVYFAAKNPRILGWGGPDAAERMIDELSER